MKPTLEEAIRDAISALCVLKFPPKDLAVTYKVWLRICQNHAVSQEELGPVLDVLLETSHEFPAPADFIEVLEKQREQTKALNRSLYLSKLKYAPDQHDMPWAVEPHELNSEGVFETDRTPLLPGAKPAFMVRSEMAYEDGLDMKLAKIEELKRMK